MKKHDILKDLLFIKEIKDLTDIGLAKLLGISRITLSRFKSGVEDIPEKYYENIYSLAYRNKIDLNQIKCQLSKEKLNKDEILLFHGSKNGLIGDINLAFSREDNDFGKGFYLGESYEQAALFVSGFENSKVYIIKIKNIKKMKLLTFKIEKNWMFAIAHYRNKIDNIKNINRIIKNVEMADIIIAPIADNRLYKVIDEYINGEMTDVQCQHALSATNLGMQYILKSDKAIKNVEIMDELYLSSVEKKNLLEDRLKITKDSFDKVKIAKRIYRNKGKYFEEEYK